MEFPRIRTRERGSWRRRCCYKANGGQYRFFWKWHPNSNWICWVRWCEINCQIISCHQWRDTVRNWQFCILEVAVCSRYNAAASSDYKVFNRIQTLPCQLLLYWITWLWPFWSYVIQNCNISLQTCWKKAIRQVCIHIYLRYSDFFLFF